MAALVPIIGFFSILALAVGIVWLVVALVKHRDKKKPGALLVAALGVFVLALVITPSKEAGESANAEATPSPKPAPTPNSTPTQTPIPVITISIQGLKAEYDANQIAADHKYKGQILQVSGALIDNISRGSGGRPRVSLGTGASFELWSLRCRFQGEAQVLKLQRGQIVTVRGTNTGMSLGDVGFEDCEVVE